MAKEQAHCDPDEPGDAQCGDYWDHVAYDPEHRLVLAVVPGARTVENAETLVGEVKRRLGGRAPELITSDEYPAYATAIETVFGEPEVPPTRPGPGRPRVAPRRRLPRRLCYATVRKHRQDDRVVAVDRVRVFGTEADLTRVLRRSTVSHRVNTSFLERQNGADRGRNARKARRTYRFSYGASGAGSSGRGRWRRAWPITSGPGANGSPAQPLNHPRTQPDFLEGANSQ